MLQCWRFSAALYFLDGKSQFKSVHHSYWICHKCLLFFLIKNALLVALLVSQREQKINWHMCWLTASLFQQKKNLPNYRQGHIYHQEQQQIKHSVYLMRWKKRLYPVIVPHLVRESNYIIGIVVMQPASHLPSHSHSLSLVVTHFLFFFIK